MPGPLAIRFDVSDKASNLFHVLGSRKFRIAISLAVNDTGKQTSTHAAREVGPASGASAKYVKRAFSLIRAKPENLTATVRAEGNPIRLIAFKARKVKAGVSAAPWGKRRTFKGMFVSKMASGNKGVWVRTSSKRFPIRPTFGPSIPGVLAEAAIMRATTQHAETRLQANVLRQLDRALYKATGSR